MPDDNHRNDPWAPPESRPPEPGVDLGKSATPRPAPGPAAPPHDQPTVAAMPGAGFGPPEAGDPLPPPPIAPGGPGRPAPGPYGYPAPAAPAPGYPAHPGAYGPYGAGAWGPAPANGLGVASMVLGIISVVGCFMYGLGIVLGVLALIFGIVGRKRVQRGEANNGPIATAGIVTGAVGIALGALVLGGLIWAITEEVKKDDGLDRDDPYATSLVISDTGR
ncbi:MULTISPECIES: DUF4190 domain-containing protein [Streptomyces]|uniref:DUF4190 domain-containing protein n=2 Tax=Streptomyces TaxID=1883 RepID=A0A100Y2X5_9ACTN|nr:MULTISPECIES: DUF4190 domain-containing protein [Streptomyces]KUH36719.1 hypothetical protein ATE80_22040 [Streptomyces kanasensis]UUS33200.1 DUF4190 domain-containing protein [Streptomyces changanensis]